MRAIEIATDDWPLVRFRMNGNQTDDDIEQYIEEFESFFLRGEKFVTITEVIDFDANFRHIKRVAEWTKTTAGLSGETCIGAALVLDSNSLRYLLSSFLLITPMPIPFRCVKTFEEALEWLRERAEKGGIELGPVSP